MSIFWFLLGAIPGVVATLVLPWWLGNSGHSLLWLWIIAIPLMLTQNPTTSYNVVRFSENRISAVFWVVIIRTLMIGGILCLPYYIGKWMA